MDIQQTPDGILMKVKVRANAPKFLLHDDGTLEVKARPEKGRANREIMNGLRKKFGCEVQIVWGAESKEKMILLRGMSAEKLNSMLRQQ